MIQSRRLIDFEKQPDENTMSVGRFHFSESVFQTAIDYLNNIRPASGADIIIDEIGKLELRGEGFHQALLHQLELVRRPESSHRLILVVRDSLLDQVMSAYSIQEASILTIKEFLPEFELKRNIPLSGIILCGGESARMGTDKSFLRYHSTEQYRHLAQLFSSLEIPVLISCNEQQKNKFEQGYELIVDDREFGFNGPITGLLSVHKKYPGHSFILVGCDYPLLEKEHIQILTSMTDFGFDAVCFVGSSPFSVNEPLVTYYSNAFLKKLHDFFLSGNTSIKKLLDVSNTLQIIMEKETFLRSFDTPEDFHSFHQK